MTVLSDTIWSAQHHLLISIFHKILELCLACKQVCDKLKWTKDQVLADVVRNLIKNKIHQIKFIVWFLRRPAFAGLLPFIYCMRESVRRLNRQWCRSRRWWSSAEVVFNHIIGPNGSKNCQVRFQLYFHMSLVRRGTITNRSWPGSRAGGVCVRVTSPLCCLATSFSIAG